MAKSRRSSPPTVPPDNLRAIRLAYDLIVAGHSEFELVERFRAEFGDIDTATVLPMVMDRFKESADFDSEVLVGWCLESARNLYRQMVEAGDFQGALRAVKLVADIAACKSA